MQPTQQNVHLFFIIQLQGKLNEQIELARNNGSEQTMLDRDQLYQPTIRLPNPKDEGNPQIHQVIKWEFFPGTREVNAFVLPVGDD